MVSGADQCNDEPGKPRTGAETRRRRFLALCSSLAVGGCTAPTLPEGTDGPQTDRPWTSSPRADAGASAGDWRLKRGDAANTGYNPAATRTTGTNETVWRSGVGNITSPPAVVGDVLFAGGGQTAYAIDIATGEKQWTVGMDVTTGNFSPAVADDTVYVAGQSNGVGRLFALATSDGATEWQYNANVTTSPMAVDGRVFIATDDGGQSVLHAVDSATGEEAWTFSVGSDDRSQVGDIPAVVDGTVYCTAARYLDARTENQEGRLFALDAVTGNRQWTMTVSDPVVSAPAVSEGTIYFGDTAGTVHAVDTDTGEEQWEHRIGDSIRTAPAVADDTIYVKDAAGECSALNVADGKPAWHATTDSSGIGLSVGDDTVYVGGNSLYALHRVDGSSRWSYDVSAYSDSHYAPAITSESIYHGICIKEHAGVEYDNYIYSLE